MEDLENKLELNQSIRQSLSKMVYWAKFLAIIGFVGIGLMVIVAIVVMVIPTNNFFAGSQYLMAFFYLVMAALYFFPINYLYNFAIKGRTALNSNNQNSLEVGLTNLASNFKFIGVTVIVVISIYALVLIIAISSFAISSML